jgi:hypothetical protein
MISVADQKAMARDLARFEHDPWGFVLYAYPWGRKDSPLEHEKPRTWQKNALMAMRDRMKGWGPETASMIDRAANIAGNGNGKSALLAWILEWAMYTKDFTRGFVTAGTESQLLTKTMPEINRWHSLNIARHWFELTATAYFSAVPAEKLNYRFDIQPWNKSRPEGGAGLHNKGFRIVKLFDEASQIPDIVFETAEGSNTDTHTEIINQLFGNGTRNNGWFAEATFGTKAHAWNPVVVDCRTVEGAPMGLYDEWIKEYGIDSDFCRTHIRGLLPKSSALQFIPTEFLELGEEREAVWQPDDPLVMALDPARGGDDHSVMRFRLGWDARSFDPIRIPGSEVRDSSKLEAKVHDIYGNPRQYGLPRTPDVLIVDATGLGGPVANHLERMGYKVLQFVGAETSPDPVYANMRAYSWAKLRDALQRYLCVDEDPFLRRDIRNQEGTLNERDKVLLVKKKTMKSMNLPSPDDADTLAMLCAFHVPQIKAPKNAWEKNARDGQPKKAYSLKDRLTKQKKLTTLRRVE